MIDVPCFLPVVNIHDIRTGKLQKQAATQSFTLFEQNFFSRKEIFSMSLIENSHETSDLDKDTSGWHSVLVSQ